MNEGPLKQIRISMYFVHSQIFSTGAPANGPTTSNFILSHCPFYGAREESQQCRSYGNLRAQEDKVLLFEALQVDQGQ